MAVAEDAQAATPPVVRAVEAALTLLVAIALARLIWAAVTPAGPMGDWRGRGIGVGAAAPMAGVDPFFRDAGDPAAVSDLALVLVGTRVDTVSGRGSAIIATPDGQQASYLVGETVLPGVTLTAVAFDAVTLARSGRQERLFLDQSDPPTTAATAPPPTMAPPPAGTAMPIPVNPPGPAR